MDSHTYHFCPCLVLCGKKSSCVQWWHEVLQRSHLLLLPDARSRLCGCRRLRLWLGRTSHGIQSLPVGPVLKGSPGCQTTTPNSQLHFRDGRILLVPLLRRVRLSAFHRMTVIGPRVILSTAAAWPSECTQAVGSPIQESIGFFVLAVLPLVLLMTSLFGLDLAGRR